ncbi:hypothetical protein [Methylobacterium isbiliense]|uniref:hypothetical protein n=1 Tax=Methylobacterium isbiliense TaxID=315478 RepID=UPI0025B3FD7B|nr:hypothetical protein [Methylobacterium isbiliense]MDN3627680.1 hypothetical protein [Methylobacterium isbiliense]
MGIAVERASAAGQGNDSPLAGLGHPTHGVEEGIVDRSEAHEGVRIALAGIECGLHAFGHECIKQRDLLRSSNGADERDRRTAFHDVPPKGDGAT